MAYGWIYRVEVPASVPHNISFLIKFRIFCIFFFRKTIIHVWIEDHHGDYVADWTETSWFLFFKRFSRNLSIDEDTVYTIFLGWA